MQSFNLKELVQIDNCKDNTIIIESLIPYEDYFDDMCVTFDRLRNQLSVLKKGYRGKRRMAITY